MTIHFVNAMSPGSRGTLTYRRTCEREKIKMKMETFLWEDDSNSTALF